MKSMRPYVGDQVRQEAKNLIACDPQSKQDWLKPWSQIELWVWNQSGIQVLNPVRKQVWNSL